MRQFLLPDSYFTDCGTPSKIGSVGAGEESLLTLEGKDFHYLVHVLRLPEGKEFPGVDRQGRRYQLKILSIRRDTLILSARPTRDHGSPSEKDGDCRIYLFQALLKGKKMDTVIRQASEAGVGHIIPVISEHTVVRLGEEKREAHKKARWEAIIGEAVQQSGSATSPQLHRSLLLEEIGDFWKKESTNSGLGLFFHQHPLENSSLHGYLSNWPHKLALLIGPEGGFSDGETIFLRTAGFFPVYLQTNILRAETAAIYAVGAIQTILREQGKWQIAQPSQQTRDTVE